MPQKGFCGTLSAVSRVFRHVPGRRPNTSNPKEPRLQVIDGVLVVFQEDDRVRSRQVEPQAAHRGGQPEQRHP